MPDQSTKDLILNAAIDLFAQYGRNGVSTARIAESAGVNKALIFYYFSSKDGLYEEVFRHIVGRVVTLTKEVASAEKGLPEIESFVTNHINSLRENPALIKIVFRELYYGQGFSSSLLKKELAATFNNLRTQLVQAIRNARERDQIRDVDLFHTVFSIISLDIFFFFGKPIFELIAPEIDVEQLENDRAEHVLDLLLNGIRRKEECIT